jgi:hypothetical protein
MVGRYNNALNNGCTMTNYKKKKKKTSNFIGVADATALGKNMSSVFFSNYFEVWSFLYFGDSKGQCSSKACYNL